jgi:pyruvate/2-oxoglutarate/acetoin dehydrogenase E1 component
LAADAAEKLAAEGIDVELIDPRSIKPLDMKTIAESVRKTNRVVVVGEGHRTGGLTSELAARIMDDCFDHLDGPIKRVAAEDVPIPYNRRLELETVPAVKDIIAAVRALMA